MSDVVIRAEGLGKKYIIQHAADHGRYPTLRDSLAASVKGVASFAMLRRDRPLARSKREEFWALRGVSFEIRRGEVVGIVGRNGAGKSTLLKILSRITEPTEGRAEIRGRVASLLEVGTGFHPELSGRENIFLNGAILGMKRAEVRRKFDEIVAFSEVDKFLDMPVKRYSSGMAMRLAFAVAAHLEPEIMVIDEVLAVGDAEFQKKCLGRMEQTVGQGRTILFVSHNLPALSGLCPTSLLLKNGVLTDAGPTPAILARYRQQARGDGNKLPGLDGFTLSADCSIAAETTLKSTLEFDLESSRMLEDACIVIRDSRDARISIFDFREHLGLPKPFSPGRHRLEVSCKTLGLVAGDYSLDAFIKADGRGGDIRDIAGFTLPSARSSRQEYEAKYQGVVRLPFEVEYALRP